LLEHRKGRQIRGLMGKRRWHRYLIISLWGGLLTGAGDYLLSIIRKKKRKI
jgi:hypothetical protein